MTRDDRRHPRAFEELKAEQDALWAEINSNPAPPSYDEYVRAMVQEGIDYCNRPDAVFYTQEEVEQMMAEQRATWRARSTDTAQSERILLSGDVPMVEDTRSFEEIKAEQDALLAEMNSKPAPAGYDEWVREKVEEGIREMEKPGAIFYSQEEIEQESNDQIRSWRLRERKTA